ncbi:IS630 transposase-related protein [Candidatus Regiella endosymbiont of Tuberolachnus salignus]|uniref:IS630 transposase-related protein n=1 Tax=Candidatus Regiella endosymbiont of Tuberolachnus salignus TaxID=3077956 RepID=UPI0030CE157E
MTYPLKFRQHVLAIKTQEKLTYAQTATRFCVGTASLMRWAKRIEPCLTRDKPATKINQAALILDVETYPDASQHERAQRMGVSARGICDALKRAGFSYKKNILSSQNRRPSAKRFPKQAPGL